MRGPCTSSLLSLSLWTLAFLVLMLRKKLSLVRNLTYTFKHIFPPFKKNILMFTRHQKSSIGFPLAKNNLEVLLGLYICTLRSNLFSMKINLGFETVHQTQHIYRYCCKIYFSVSLVAAIVFVYYRIKEICTKLCLMSCIIFLEFCKLDISQGETIKLPISITDSFHRPPWFQVSYQKSFTTG